MRTLQWSRHLLIGAMMLSAAGLTGCKTFTERYIALEVWKYEKCFGHYPPGFVPPGAAAAAAAPAAMRPCGQPSDCCAQAPCQSASFAPGERVVGGEGCDGCQGAVVEGGIPAGGMPAGSAAPALPAGPGGSPGPMPSLGSPAAVSASRPVVISDEVVLP